MKTTTTILTTAILIIVASMAFADVPQVINYQGYLIDSGGDPVDGPVLINFKIYGSEFGDDSLWWSGFQSIQVDSGFFNYQLGSNSPLPSDFFGPGSDPFLGIIVSTDPEITPRTAITSSAFSWHSNSSNTADFATEAISASTAISAMSSVSADNAYALGGQMPAYYLSWSNMTGIPPGFADGVDDIGGMGDIEAVIAGSGLTGGGTSGDVVLAVDAEGITSSHIATDAVGTDEIIDGGVHFDDIATDAVGSSAIRANAVNNSEIASNAVGTNQIADHTITNDDISNSAAIETSKIYGTAVNLSDHQTMTGVKTFANAVLFGDSLLAASGSGNNMSIGRSSVASTRLLNIARNYSTSNDKVALGIDMDNSIPSGGDVFGTIITTDNHDLSTGDRYGANIDVGSSSNLYSYSYGVRSFAYGGSYAYGFYGVASGATNNTGGFFSPGKDGIGYAGYFAGDVEATGFNTFGSSGMKIDHPLDPENKYLIHSNVESPDMMNIYSGNVTTNTNGNASVKLPDYFESLNVDFRYQLTVLGDFAQAIISNEIQGNSFTIKTDKPFIKVSWQVTGVRNDAYAKSNPVSAEIDKLGHEMGKYLHYEEHGKSFEQSVNYEHLKAIYEEDEITNE